MASKSKHKCPDAVLDPIIKRLRRSREASRDSAGEAGFSMGIDWAKKWAEYVELERLSSARESVIWRTTESFGDFVRLLNDEADWTDVDSFWEAAGVSITEYAAFDDAFVEGFYSGAMEVWDAVNSQLDP